jgi:hypothetical protein
MRQPCSRDFPSDLSGWWQPSTDDVMRADRHLAEALHAHTAVLSPQDRDRAPQRYYRQYMGMVRGGRRVMYVNAIGVATLAGSGEEVPIDEKWRRSTISICDGGLMSFGAVFDLQSDRFDAFSFNADFAGRVPGATQ